MISKEEILALIDARNDAVERALHILVDLQTDMERETESTSLLNGVGFNAYDAPFLTSLGERVANFIARGGSYGHALSPRQIAAGRRSVRKYAGQLARIAAAN